MLEQERNADALDPQIHMAVRQAIGPYGLTSVEVVQSLWSGYGSILRIGVDAAEVDSLIVKRVRWPTQAHHPRGWTTSRSHARKVKSYAVESAFYATYADDCDHRCRVPKCLASASVDDGILLVLEDLNTDGLSERPQKLEDRELRACLSWLAHFHATFLQRAPAGLWASGTYWHLQTRPDELAVLGDSPLARAAPLLDDQLRSATFQTLVHGDAKVANFCFGDDGRVGAVDFQYIGGGCGIQDVAYFLGSCLSEADCAAHETRLLDIYFSDLRAAVADRHNDIDIEALCAQWRALFAVAWTDFYRFVAGWSPEDWKIHAYTRRLAREVLQSL